MLKWVNIDLPAPGLISLKSNSGVINPKSQPGLNREGIAGRCFRAIVRCLRASRGAHSQTATTAQDAGYSLPPNAAAGRSVRASWP